MGLIASLGLATVACSDDEQTTEAAASNEAGGGTTSTAAPAPTGEPIKVGFVNSEGGAFSVPEIRVGNEVAEEYINTQLGGVKGRPLEVVRCATDGSPEASIDCANELVEAGVVAVVEGTDLGADAMLPILSDAKIPLVGHVQFGPARMFDANSYYFGAAALAYGTAALKYYTDDGAKSVTWFLPDEPSSHAFTDGVLLPTAEKLGIEYKTVYYDAANPNWAVLATTAASENPDVSGTIAATDGQCAEMIPALRDAGYQGRILAASCVGLYEAIGDDAVGVDTDADHWHPGDVDAAPPEKQEELKEYAAAMEAAGEEDLIGGNAVISFADMITLARILGTIEGATVDGAAVAAAMQATNDFEGFNGPPLTCDHTVIAGNSACTVGMLFFQIQEDGSVKTMTDDFLDLSGLL